jgi:hypothetical protein
MKILEPGLNIFRAAGLSQGEAFSPNCEVVDDTAKNLSSRRRFVLEDFSIPRVPESA